MVMPVEMRRAAGHTGTQTCTMAVGPLPVALCPNDGTQGIYMVDEQQLVRKYHAAALSPTVAVRTQPLVCFALCLVAPTASRDGYEQNANFYEVSQHMTDPDVAQ
jgi:hypothetical protein